MKKIKDTEKPNLEKPIPDFESGFKKIIKDIISEEDFVTKGELRIGLDATLEELEPLISKLIKRHLVELSKIIKIKFEDCPPPKIGE